MSPKSGVASKQASVTDRRWQGLDGREVGPDVGSERNRCLYEGMGGAVLRTIVRFPADRCNIADANLGKIPTYGCGHPNAATRIATLE